MGRIIGIDYGKSRTGIAVTDRLRLIPGPLTTLPAREVIAFLQTYMAQEEVDLIVVGEAKQTHSGEDSDSMREIRPFVGRLKKAFPTVDVVLHDERYTSLMAKQTIQASGIPKKKRQNKALVDQVSAVIILQSYMEHKGL